MKTIRHHFFMVCMLLLAINTNAQNTVGTLTYNDGTFEGYNLLYPLNQGNIYLINNCGQIVNQWTDESDSIIPGSAAYLLEDGRLLRCNSFGFTANPIFPAGGAADVIEIRDWDNSLLWSFTLSNDTARLHHDVTMLPNGNILMLVWDLKTTEEAIQAGRDPATIGQEAIWADRIIEVEPIGTDDYNIVWEWQIWDHLIQDFDETKDNYGVIAEHPELVNINYHDGTGDADWLHTNSLDYNTFNSQIILSAPSLGEIWIIDHTTSTEEAATHAGGWSGKGGDLMFRWGNPETYGAGTPDDKKLFFQHDVRIMDLELTGDPNYGKIMVFNNRNGGGTYSSVHIINPLFDGCTWNFVSNADGMFFPDDFDWSYSYDPPTQMYSNILSSAQRLSNGNTLICSGFQGWMFEITPDEEVVWEYKNPFIVGNPVDQGTSSSFPGISSVFQLKRYSPSYPAFEGRDLEEGDYIEGNPNPIAPCGGIGINDITESNCHIYPNPTSQYLHINNQDELIQDIVIYHLNGTIIHEAKPNSTNYQLAIQQWATGVYYVRINNNRLQKILIH